ncbi:MAG: hypothetical protein HYT68_01600 [Candidatus Zambryskibacteria bacterium]|nr:hypothetical protein [Candidatus Zambryskibacteria bacterium]
MTYSKEIVKKIYRSLPDELKQIVATQETSSINDETAQKYHLKTDQRLQMGDEVTMRLIGLTTENDFVKNIETRLKTTLEISQKIADDVKTKILSKAPEKLLRAQEEYAQTKLKELPQQTIASTEISSAPLFNPTPTPKILEIAPKNLPIVEPGEIAHDVRSESRSMNQESRTEIGKEDTKIEEPEIKNTPAKDRGYPEDKDPYREPIA